MKEDERKNLHEEAERAAHLAKNSKLPCVVPSNNIVYAFLTYVVCHLGFAGAPTDVV